MWSPRLRKGLAVLGGLLLAGSFAAAFSFDSPLVLDVAPRVAIGRSDIRVTTKIWPSDANRALVIQLLSDDGDEHVDELEFTTSAEANTISRTRWYRSIDPGNYVVTACLQRTDKLVCQSQPVEIHD